MTGLYLVDLLLREERSATVLVEAGTEDDARELALTRTPEDQFGTLDCEDEVRISTMVPGMIEVSNDWGEYQVDRLVCIESGGRVRYPSGRSS